MFAGIYASFIVYLFVATDDVVSNLAEIMASFGCVATNLMAVLSVAYTKFSNCEFVHKRVYWLSLWLYVLILAIYLQAGVVVDQHVNLVIPVLGTFGVTVLLQLLFVWLVVMLSKQKTYDIKLRYRKVKGI